MVTQATAREAARLIIRRTALQVHPQQMMLLQNQVPEAARFVHVWVHHLMQLLASGESGWRDESLGRPAPPHQGPQLRSSTTYCVCSIYMHQSFQVQQIITCSATSS